MERLPLFLKNCVSTHVCYSDKKRKSSEIGDFLFLYFLAPVVSLARFLSPFCKTLLPFAFLGKILLIQYDSTEIDPQEILLSKVIVTLCIAS